MLCVISYLYFTALILNINPLWTLAPKIRVYPMGDTDFLCLILSLMRSKFCTTIANKTVLHILIYLSFFINNQLRFSS